MRPEASARICEKLSVCTYENLGGGGCLRPQRNGTTFPSLSLRLSKS